jgi:hypothetical protein
MCTAEFVIAGLLPDIAADLGVRISTAGLLISGYAAAIVVGGPLSSLRAPGSRGVGCWRSPRPCSSRGACCPPSLARTACS